MKEVECNYSQSSKTESHPTAKLGDAVESAASGGHAPAASLETSDAHSDVPTAVSPAARRLSLDGWLCESFDMGFRVGRSVRLGDLHIVLSVGEADSGGPTEFDVPTAVLVFLMTGEADARNK